MSATRLLLRPFMRRQHCLRRSCLVGQNSLAHSYMKKASRAGPISTRNGAFVSTIILVAFGTSDLYDRLSTTVPRDGADGLLRDDLFRMPANIPCEDHLSIGFGVEQMSRVVWLDPRLLTGRCGKYLTAMGISSQSSQLGNWC